MAMRLPKSERSPSPSSSPPPDQREAVIQELTRGRELAALLRQQMELIPELDRRDDALANVRDISMSLRSSISALQSERGHCGSSSGAGAAVSSVSDGGGGGGRNRKTKNRRGRHDGELIKEILTTTPENDGFHWRKYGEKNILNTEFPKLYYRCGYSDERKCRAKKYVQQENKKHPPEFKVTLINEHACNTLIPNQPSSSSTSQVLDFTKASIISSPMNPLISAPILKEEEEEVPSIDESSRIMSTTMPSYEAYDYNELSPQSWDGGVWQ
uniref:WRKY domain-containing protein n=1 Tax=Leersia perrieri TaxID=77586 RepID=A0A0D9WHQ7_9ORYZ